MPAFFDEWADGFERLLRTGNEIHGFTADLDLAARDARHVEQILNQARHLADLAADHFALSRQNGGIVTLHSQELNGV